jgi:hypothetical protein
VFSSDGYGRHRRTSPNQWRLFESPRAGLLERRRGQLSRECVVGVASYFSFHRINEEVALGVLLPPHPPRRNQFAPSESDDGPESAGRRVTLAPSKLPGASKPVNSLAVSRGGGPSPPPRKRLCCSRYGQSPELGRRGPLKSSASVRQIAGS